MAFSARIRQFLLESKFLPGNPSLIEIVEPTLSGPRIQFLARMGPHIDDLLDNLLTLRALKLLMKILFYISLGVGAFFYLRKYHENLFIIQQVSTDEQVEEQKSVVFEQKKSNKKRRRRRRKTILPGKKIK